MLHTKTFPHNAITLTYSEAPGPGPALLILHGLSGSRDEFLHLAPALSQQAHVYFLDLRGHGESGHGAGYLVADYAQDVVAFLQQVVARPVVLLGHSLGGLVAARLAAHEPHLFHGLILEDPGFYILSMPRFGQSPYFSYFSALRDFLARYQQRDAPFQEMLAFVSGAPATNGQSVAEPVRQRAVQLQQMDPSVLDPTLSGDLMGALDSDDLLARIQIPVHLIAADPALGSALGDEDIQRFLKAVPHATHTRIHGAGHDIHLDKPQVFVKEVTWFLETG